MCGFLCLRWFWSYLEFLDVVLTLLKRLLTFGPEWLRFKAFLTIWNSWFQIFHFNAIWHRNIGAHCVYQLNAFTFRRLSVWFLWKWFWLGHTHNYKEENFLGFSSLLFVLYLCVCRSPFTTPVPRAYSECVSGVQKGSGWIWAVTGGLGLVPFPIMRLLDPPNWVSLFPGPPMRTQHPLI